MDTAGFRAGQFIGRLLLARSGDPSSGLIRLGRVLHWTLATLAVLIAGAGALVFIISLASRLEWQGPRFAWDSQPDVQWGFLLGALVVGAATVMIGRALGYIFSNE